MLNGDENVTYDLRAIVRQEDVSEDTPAAESQIQHERVQPSVATGRITGKPEVGFPEATANSHRAIGPH
jgi:hypothetical protein